MPHRTTNDAPASSTLSKHPVAWALALFTLAFMTFLGCQKKYTTAPLSPPVLTPTPTITLSPTVTFTPPSAPNAYCAEIPISDVTGYIDHGPYFGDTTMSTDRFADLGGAGSPDDLLVFTVFQDGYYTFSMCGGANWDSFMYLRTRCDDPTSDLISDDDGCGNNLSRFDLDLPPGVYYLIVDGLGGAAGAYQLSITTGPMPTPSPTP